MCTDLFLSENVYFDISNLFNFTKFAKIILAIKRQNYFNDK